MLFLCIIMAKPRSIFKYEVCSKSNITNEKICMPQRNRKEATSYVKKLRLDNKAHLQAGDIIRWKDIKVRPRKR